MIRLRLRPIKPLKFTVASLVTPLSHGKRASWQDFWRPRRKGGDAMTRMLASVANAAEAGVVVQLGADIVDLKDARRGALGAVSLDVARQAIAAVAGRSETSAALGDPPYDRRSVARKRASAGRDGRRLRQARRGCADARSPRRFFEQARARRRPRRHDVRRRKARLRSPRQAREAGLQGRDARHPRQDTRPAHRASRGRAA